MGRCIVSFSAGFSLEGVEVGDWGDGGGEMGLEGREGIGWIGTGEGMCC